MAPPEGVTSIAVEAVYDTSREVVPHELLWRSLQEAFAANGRLRLTSPDHADVLLRSHLTWARVSPPASPTPVDSDSTQKKDPAIPFDELVQRNPATFRNLTRGGSFSTNENIQMKVEVEIWNLKSKDRIFTRSYSVGGSFISIRDEARAGISTQYLLYDEALRKRFLIMSQSIAERVVSDFLL